MYMLFPYISESFYHNIAWQVKKVVAWNKRMLVGSHV